MPLFFVPMLGLMGIGVAMTRRYAWTPVHGPNEDVAARLLGWAVGLLPAGRAEWGRAMLGELGHIQGRIRRLRFASGCVGAALVLPPWGRAAAGVWAMIVLAVGSVAGYAGVALHYRLAGGDWVAVGILAVVVTGFLLGASALVRRPGVAVPGLVAGLIVALAWLTLSGFTFYQQIAPDIVPWHPWVEAVVVPFVLGCAGTLWSRDQIVGKRIARLAAISAGLGLYVYATIAVAVIGAGGPPDEHPTVESVVSDRLANNLVFLLFTVMVTATVGWAGTAAAGAATVRMRAATSVVPAPFTVAGPIGAADEAAMVTPEEVGDVIRERNWHRPGRPLLLCAVVGAAVLLAAVGWLRG
jgi:hypothetical protein